MVIRRHPEPLLWLLFSAGGVISAMLMPVVLLLFGIMVPLEWVSMPTHEHLRSVLANPVSRIALVTLAVFSLFHWAHRFRHTLYDGLQIKHLDEVIAVVSYGVAAAGSAAAVYIVLQLH
jgi:fumarate reductase subunit D